MDTWLQMLFAILESDLPGTWQEERIYHLFDETLRKMVARLELIPKDEESFFSRLGKLAERRKKSESMRYLLGYDLEFLDLSRQLRVAIERKERLASRPTTFQSRAQSLLFSSGLLPRTNLLP